MFMMNIKFDSDILIFTGMNHSIVVLKKILEKIKVREKGSKTPNTA